MWWSLPGFNNLYSNKQKACKLSMIANVFSPIALSIGAMLNVYATQNLQVVVSPALGRDIFSEFLVG